MTKTAVFSRRSLLAGAGALVLAIPAAEAAAPVLAEEFGVVADLLDDQTAALQQAIDSAMLRGATLQLPAGAIRVGALQLPANLTMDGVAGATRLIAASGSVATAAGAANLTLRGIGFEGAPDATLLDIAASPGISIERCQFSGGGTALTLSGSGGSVTDCAFTRHGDAAIHATDSTGFVISRNTIIDCGNGGIRVWRSEPGPDGTIVTQNRISRIDWQGGGNGQNGNGINVFRADNVILADNHLADCAFSAIRLNTTNNTQVSGNICLTSGEVAIFSEFGFSGSIIANNIVDGAAAGISMTNLDSGGHLAVCSGNIVRNIAPLSLVNPDTVPYGIAAEADAAITGNTVQSVPGIGISAGHGTFLRNVLIGSNVITGVRVGIGVSVVEGAGKVHIADNIVADARDHAVIGLAWDQIVETDLLANAANFANVTVSGATQR